MASNHNKKKSAGKNNPAMKIATRIFAAGACAEIWLLAVYRYYVRGSIGEVLAWHQKYLPALPWVGLAMVVIGLLLLFVGKKDCAKKTAAARILVGAGVFVAVTTPLIRVWYTTALTPLCVLVPGLMILGIAWCLYDRECVYALAVLCSAAMMLWICRECLPVPARQMIGRGLAVAWLVVAAAAALLLKQVRRADGMFREMRLLPVSANYALIYVALGVSAVLVVAGMLGAVLAYYALWVAAVAIFAVAVYYTVQQL
jgi:hypothetical protein